MALPQAVDQSTLNLSGIPAVSAAPAQNITNAGSKGMASPTVSQEASSVSPAAGALVGYLMGNYLGKGNSGSSGIGGTASAIGNVVKAITGAATKPSTTGGGTSSPTNGGNTVKPGVPAGNTPGIGGTSVNMTTMPPGTVQADVTAKYGTTNGEPNMVVTGVNMSTGEVTISPNYNIGGSNLGTSGGNFGVTDTTPSTPDTTSTAPTPDPKNPGYFTDQQGDIYDSNGNLLMIQMSDGNYYDPTVDSYFTPDFMPIASTDVPAADTSYVDSYTNPVDTAPVDTTAVDTSTYSPIDTTGAPIYRQGGLATPLFRRGGGVKGYVGGGTTTPTAGGYDPTATTPAPAASSSNGLVDAITNLFSNSGVQGAAMGALISQMMSGATVPVNKGVDMTALSATPPHTTTFGMGPAKYVPYSQYGTPPAAADYSSLYSNLGITPPAAPTAAAATTGASAATPAISTPTAPTGGLTAASTPVTAATPTVATPATTAAKTTPSYFTDASGNIYDANGDLVYDATTGTATSGAIASPVAATSIAPTGGATFTSDPTYSYGTPVDPATVLSTGKKKGGLAKMAMGGTPPINFNHIVNGTAINGAQNQGGYNPNPITNPIIATPFPGQNMDNNASYHHEINNNPSAYDHMDNHVDNDDELKEKLGLNHDDHDHMVNSPGHDQRGNFVGMGNDIRGTVAPNVLDKSKMYQAQNWQHHMADGGETGKPFYGVPEVAGRGDYRAGTYVQGAGDGQSDDIPAMLADGEYVIDAETVAQLGNGSNKAGAKVLDQFRQNIRAHKRSAPHDKIPPKAKSPLAYLKGAK